MFPHSLPGRDDISIMTRYSQWFDHLRTTIRCDFCSSVGAVYMSKPTLSATEWRRAFPSAPQLEARSFLVMCDDCHRLTWPALLGVVADRPVSVEAARPIGEPTVAAFINNALIDADNPFSSRSRTADDILRTAQCTIYDDDDLLTESECTKDGVLHKLDYTVCEAFANCIGEWYQWCKEKKKRQGAMVKAAR